MKRLWTFWVYLLALGVLVGTVHAQAASDVRPQIALVLSGGGARGLAHIGILQELEKAHVPIDQVVGTSMGAIVGGLYAAGMTPDELEHEFLRLDWDNLFQSRPARPLLPHRQKEEDFEFSPVLQLGFHDGEFRLPAGAVSSNALELLLRRYTLHTRHLQHFNQLPTPFRAVATDMETGKAVVIEQGDMAAALRASMSVPGVFSPLEWNGQLLGDGGLVNNLPVDVARHLGANQVIAVNIGTPLAGRDQLDSLVGITLQMINILTEQNVQRNLATLSNHDLLLTPPLGQLSSTDFRKAPELVQLGKDYAQTVVESLRRFAIPPEDYARWQAQRREVRLTLEQSNRQPLAFVRIEGVPESRAQRLLQRLTTLAGRPLDTHNIEQDVASLTGSNGFQRVDYKLEPTDSGHAEGLVYRLQSANHSDHQFRVGLALRTDFQGQADFNLRVSHTLLNLNSSSAEWRNQLELGSTSALRSELYQPYGPSKLTFASLYGEHELRKIELYDTGGSPWAQGRRITYRLGLDHGWHLGTDGRWGDLRLGWVGLRRQSLPDLVSGGSAGNDITWTESAWRLAVVTDQLDHANFPQSGHRFTLDVQSGTAHDPSGSTPFLRGELSLNAVGSLGAHTFNGYWRLVSTDYIPPGAIDEYALGGFQQLSGYHPGQIAGNNLMLGRLSYYRRLTDTPGLARAWFAGGSLEAGNAWASSRQVSWGHMHLGSSLFIGADTGFGPLYLSLVYAPQGYTGIYFQLGRP